MTKNDNVRPLKKRTLSASLWLSPITNQANVAVRLGELFGKEVNEKVWQAHLHAWEDVASEYVNLTYGNHYGTRWVNDRDTGDPGAARLSDDSFKGSDSWDSAPVPNRPRLIPPAVHQAAIHPQQVAVEHSSLTPLAGLIRFVGGRN